MLRFLLAFSLGFAGLRGDADEQYQFIAALAEKGMHDRVIKEAERFLREHEDHPKTALARYRLANAHFELRQHEPALRELRVLARERGFEYEAEVAFRLGSCELERGDCAAAEQALVRAVELDRDYLREPARWLLGEAQLRCQRYVQAEASYAAVLELAPRGKYAEDAAIGLAWCAFKAKRFEDAGARANAFLEQRPQAARVDEAAFLLGESLLELGRPTDAALAYARVARGEFVDDALRGAGFAHAALGEHARAAAAFAAVLERFADGPLAAECALHAGIELLAAGDAASAERMLDPERFGATVELLRWRARAQNGLGQRERALDSIERALDAKPDDEQRARLLTERADLLLALGRSDEALADFGRAGSDVALQSAAVASLDAKRPDDALRFAMQLLERHPGSSLRPDALFVAAEACFAKSDLERAQAAFDELAREPRFAARAKSRAAWCRYLREDHVGAAEAFAALARQHGKDPEADEASFMHARALEDGGDRAAAARAYAEYARQRPQGARVDEALLRAALLDAGDGSIERLESLVAKQPSSPLASRARFELAERLSAAGRLADAVPHYRAVLERDPPAELAGPARYGLAWSLHRTGEPARAAELLEPWAADRRDRSALAVSALELLVWTRAQSAPDRGLGQALDAFAERCDDAERVARAARIALDAWRKADRSADARAWLDQLTRDRERAEVAKALVLERVHFELERGEVERAEQELAKARVTREGDAGVAEAAYFVGEARLAAGDADRALALFDEAGSHAKNATRDRALYKAGFVRLKADQASAAEASFAALVEHCPQSELLFESLFLLGEARFRQRQWPGAIECFARVQREAPKHAVLPKALFRLGLARLEADDARGALDALSKLLRDQPAFENAVEAELARGRALTRLERGREARASFERVIAGDKGVLSARAHLELGRLSVAAGELDDALSEFLKVAVLYEAPEEVAQALFEAGAVLEAQGDAKRALEQYVEAATKHGKTTYGKRAAERARELGHEPRAEPKRPPARRDA